MPFGYDPNDSDRIFNKVEENPYMRVYLEVDVIYKKTGQMIPIFFTWGGKQYKIDKLLECQKGQSLKFGIGGLRYRCQAGGKNFYLFYTGDSQCQWYVEVRK